MTIQSILAFSAAMLILAISPGPGIFATVSQALSSGFRSSVGVVGGIVIGDLLFLFLAVFGLSALAYALGDLFFYIKLLGGAYLVWLGFRMWIKVPVPLNQSHNLERRNGWQRFLGGLVITLGNPKVILFYAGFLPTFIDLSELQALDIIIIAGLVASILIVVLGAYSFAASRARVLFTSLRAIKALNRGAGTVMIGTGIVVATR